MSQPSSINEQKPCNFLYVEEINTNNSNIHRIDNIEVTQTVRDLKVAIATWLGDSKSWENLSLAYGTDLLSNINSSLSSYGIRQEGIVHFTRSIAAVEEPLPVYQAKEIVLQNVMFKNLDGRTLMLHDVPISWTVQQLRQKLGREKSLAVEDYRFLWGGKQLEDRVFDVETLWTWEGLYYPNGDAFVRGEFVVSEMFDYRCRSGW